MIILPGGATGPVIEFISISENIFFDFSQKNNIFIHAVGCDGSVSGLEGYAD